MRIALYRVKDTAGKGFDEPPRRAFNHSRAQTEHGMGRLKGRDHIVHGGKAVARRLWR